MTKIINVVVTIVFTFGFCSAAMSDTIGNPTATVGDRMSAVDVSVDFTNRDIDVEGGGDDDVDSNRILVKGTYGIEPINIYAKLGVANVEVDDADGDYGLAFGFGIKATVHETPNAKVGIGLQYLSFESEDTVNGVDYEADVSSEIDIFAGVSYLGLQNNITPYGGLVISMIDGDLEVEGWGSADFEEDDTLGIFAGIDFDASDQFKAGVELRLINETSITLKVSYLF
jgi:hypothetical protein